MEGNKELDQAGGDAGSVGQTSCPVPATAGTRECVMISKDRWEEIRRLGTSGMSVSAIARRLDLDRKTVRTWLRRETCDPRSPAQVEASRCSGSVSGLGSIAASGPRGLPFPRRVSFPSTVSSVLRANPTPDLSSNIDSGIASSTFPTANHHGGAGRASHVPTIAFCT
jgi:hypothetical protein